MQRDVVDHGTYDDVRIGLFLVLLIEIGGMHVTGIGIVRGLTWVEEDFLTTKQESHGHE